MDARAAISTICAITTANSPLSYLLHSTPKEIWEIYESGKLTPDTELTGHFDEPTESADVDAVMSEIQEAFKEEQERLARMQSADED